MLLSLALALSSAHVLEQAVPVPALEKELKVQHGMNDEPIYDTIDLDATYSNIVAIFERMNLSPEDMAALIGGGHASGKASLNAGEYFGQWVAPEYDLGSQYFKQLALAQSGQGWCAIQAEGSAYFVRNNDQNDQPEYTPEISNCITTPPSQSKFVELPSLDAGALSSVGEYIYGSVGAVAVPPVDFMLTYASTTRGFVKRWGDDEEAFYTAFESAWKKLTENGVQQLCPGILNYKTRGWKKNALPGSCLTATGNAQSRGKRKLANLIYYKAWTQVYNAVTLFVASAQDTCSSVRSTYCLPSIFRLGWHVSASYDPHPEAGTDTFANGQIAGSEGNAFQGACQNFDGCGGCLSGTVAAIKQLGDSLQSRYPSIKISLPDMIILAASIAGEKLSNNGLSLVSFFSPGRNLVTEITEEICTQIANRFPAPAYVPEYLEAQKAAGKDPKKKVGCPFANLSAMFAKPSNHGFFKSS